MKGKLLFLGVFLFIFCGFFIYSLNDNEKKNYNAPYSSSDDLQNEVIKNKEINNKDEKTEEDKKIKQQILDEKLKQQTSINVNSNVDSNDVEMKDNFIDQNVNNDDNVQINNYEYIESQNNDIIHDIVQNNVSDNNSNENDNNSDNQDYNVPTNIDDIGINNNTNTDLYSTYEECNQAGVDLMFKVMSDDIINTFCFSYAENGELIGYRLDINCKSGNCDKYK